MNITFNELREIKDNLPDGAMQTIADDLGISAEVVRSYFGGTHYQDGVYGGISIEQGPDGGIVKITDTTILDKAKEMLNAEIH